MTSIAIDTSVSPKHETGRIKVFSSVWRKRIKEKKRMLSPKNSCSPRNCFSPKKPDAFESSEIIDFSRSQPNTPNSGKRGKDELLADRSHRQQDRHQQQLGGPEQREHECSMFEKFNNDETREEICSPPCSPSDLPQREEPEQSRGEGRHCPSQQKREQFQPQRNENAFISEQHNPQIASREQAITFVPEQKRSKFETRDQDIYLSKQQPQFDSKDHVDQHLHSKPIAYQATYTHHFNAEIASIAEVSSITEDGKVDTSDGYDDDYASHTISTLTATQATEDEPLNIKSKNEDPFHFPGDAFFVETTKKTKKRRSNDGMGDILTLHASPKSEQIDDQKVSTPTRGSAQIVKSHDTGQDEYERQDAYTNEYERKHFFVDHPTESTDKPEGFWSEKPSAELTETQGSETNPPVMDLFSKVDSTNVEKFDAFILQEKSDKQEYDINYVTAGIHKATAMEFSSPAQSESNDSSPGDVHPFLTDGNGKNARYADNFSKPFSSDNVGEPVEKQPIKDNMVDGPQDGFPWSNEKSTTLWWDKDKSSSYFSKPNSTKSSGWNKSMALPGVQAEADGSDPLKTGHREVHMIPLEKCSSWKTSKMERLAKLSPKLSKAEKGTNQAGRLESRDANASAKEIKDDKPAEQEIRQAMHPSSVEKNVPDTQKVQIESRIAPFSDRRRLYEMRQGPPPTPPASNVNIFTQSPRSWNSPKTFKPPFTPTRVPHDALTENIKQNDDEKPVLDLALTPQLPREEEPMKSQRKNAEYGDGNVEPRHFVNTGLPPLPTASRSPRLKNSDISHGLLRYKYSKQGISSPRNSHLIDEKPAIDNNNTHADGVGNNINEDFTSTPSKNQSGKDSLRGEKEATKKMHKTGQPLAAVQSKNHMRDLTPATSVHPDVDPYETPVSSPRRSNLMQATKTPPISTSLQPSEIEGRFEIEDERETENESDIRKESGPKQSKSVDEFMSYNDRRHFFQSKFGFSPVVGQSQPKSSQTILRNDKEALAQVADVSGASSASPSPLESRNDFPSEGEGRAKSWTSRSPSNATRKDSSSSPYTSALPTYPKSTQLPMQRTTIAPPKPASPLEAEQSVDGTTIAEGRPGNLDPLATVDLSGGMAEKDPKTTILSSYRDRRNFFQLKFRSSSSSPVGDGLSRSRALEAARLRKCATQKEDVLGAEEEPQINQCSIETVEAASSNHQKSNANKQDVQFDSNQRQDANQSRPHAIKNFSRKAFGKSPPPDDSGDVYPVIRTSQDPMEQRISSKAKPSEKIVLEQPVEKPDESPKCRPKAAPKKNTGEFPSYQQRRHFFQSKFGSPATSGHLRPLVRPTSPSIHSQQAEESRNGETLAEAVWEYTSGTTKGKSTNQNRDSEVESKPPHIFDYSQTGDASISPLQVETNKYRHVTPPKMENQKNQNWISTDNVPFHSSRKSDRHVSFKDEEEICTIKDQNSTRLVPNENKTFIETRSHPLSPSSLRGRRYAANSRDHLCKEDSTGTSNNGALLEPNGSVEAAKDVLGLVNDKKSIVNRSGSFHARRALFEGRTSKSNPEGATHPTRLAGSPAEIKIVHNNNTLKNTIDGEELLDSMITGSVPAYPKGLKNASPKQSSHARQIVNTKEEVSYSEDTMVREKERDFIQPTHHTSKSCLNGREGQMQQESPEPPTTCDEQQNDFRMQSGRPSSVLRAARLNPLASTPSSQKLKETSSISMKETPIQDDGENLDAPEHQPKQSRYGLSQFPKLAARRNFFESKLTTNSGSPSSRGLPSKVTTTTTCSSPHNVPRPHSSSKTVKWNSMNQEVPLEEVYDTLQLQASDTVDESATEASEDKKLSKEDVGSQYALPAEISPRPRKSKARQRIESPQTRIPAIGVTTSPKNALRRTKLNNLRINTRFTKMKAAHNAPSAYEEHGRAKATSSKPTNPIDEAADPTNPGVQSSFYADEYLSLPSLNHPGQQQQGKQTSAYFPPRSSDRRTMAQSKNTSMVPSSTSPKSYVPSTAHSSRDAAGSPRKVLQQNAIDTRVKDVIDTKVRSPTRLDYPEGAEGGAEGGECGVDDKKVDLGEPAPSRRPPRPSKAFPSSNMMMQTSSPTRKSKWHVPDSPLGTRRGFSLSPRNSPRASPPVHLRCF